MEPQHQRQQYMMPPSTGPEKAGYGPAPPYAQAQAPSHGAVGKWSFGLFDCCSPFSTCCMATWCPCILFGKTHAREHGDSDSSGCNAMCCAWYALACIGGSCILQCINRQNMREKYGIEGSTLGDFCGAYCCPCCQLIQEDKESIVRVTGVNPKTKQAYASPDQMIYP